MKSKSWLLVAVFSLGCLTKIAAQSADLILTNGKIFTSDTSQLFVQALAIKGNKIMAVGSSTAISKLATPTTKRIDLAGRTVVPGFNDAHEHLGFFAPVGQFFTSSFSEKGLDKRSVLDSVSRLVKAAKPNQWIIGPIGLSVLQDLTMRKALDSLVPDHPVYLQIMWGHGAVLNSKALQMVGIAEDATDPLGGFYVRQPGTQEISAIWEYAQWPVWHAAWASEPENLIKSLRAYAHQQVQAGITTVQDMSCNFNPTALSGIYHDANLPLRLRIIAMPGTSPSGRSLTVWKKVKQHPSPLTYVSGIKYILDGTGIEQTSLSKKPYPGKQNWYGRLNMPIDTIKQILHEALTSNTQLMIHMVGDSTFAIVLPLMKQMAGGEIWRSKRVRIEHNATATITAEETNTINELGLLVMHTPKYNHSSHLRSFMEKGITVGISPDGTTNPFWDIMAVTSMQTNPAENMTREQAVIAYTKTNAYAEFMEKQKGTLAKGMLADLAVLSQDIFTIPTAQLPAIQSVLTIVDGKIVYQQPNGMSTKK
jgi:predicted amidohydrolase YtcJ